MGLGDYDRFGSGDAARQIMEHALKEGRENVTKWANEMMAGMERWAAEQGFSPLKAEGALALIDELKTRGVKSFEGLGIKVTL